MIEHSKPTLGKEEEKAIVEVYKTTFISEGLRTRQFERELAEFFNVPKAKCLPSGFIAIFLTVLALGGDRLKIYMPSFVCREVFDAIKMAGCEPVLCDIGEDFNISISDIKKKLTRRTKSKKAILLPHMFGQPADIDLFLQLDIPIIEDCAHSIGASCYGKLTGSIGDIGILSFESTKMMTTGYGGAVISRKKNLINKIEHLLTRIPLGRAPQYHFYFTDIQSSIGIVQLRRLSDFIKTRKRIATKYMREFASLPVMLPKLYQGREHIFYRFMIGSERLAPKSIIEMALKKNMKIKQVVPALHRYLGLDKKDFPMTETALKRWVSIPIYPSLSHNEVSSIVSGIKEVFSH